MAIAGLDGRLGSVNLALAQLTGLRAEVLRRATLESLLHPEDIEGPALGIQALEDDPAAVYVAQTRILHADGHEIWVSLQVAVIRDGAGRPLHLLVQLQDMTERRREEERLRTLADRDALTRLLNHNGFRRELRRHAVPTSHRGASRRSSGRSTVRTSAATTAAAMGQRDSAKADSASLGSTGSRASSPDMMRAPVDRGQIAILTLSGDRPAPITRGG